jgi:hypothetical protein
VLYENEAHESGRRRHVGRCFPPVRLCDAPDFTTLTDSVDFSTAIAAILLVMAGLAGVYIVMKGGSLILSKLRGG